MTKKKKAPKKKEIARLEIVYALRHIGTGELLQLERSSNEGSDFCNDTTATLRHCCYDYDDFNPDIWYIDSVYNAEYVRQHSTEWYNSCERTPQHSYEPDELEVVEVRREITSLTKKVTIPTYLEYLELKYKEKEPGHYEYIVKEYETRKHGSWNYSLYDLLELIANKKWVPEGGELNG
jgi:hypothetical protein